MIRHSDQIKEVLPSRETLNLILKSAKPILTLIVFASIGLTAWQLSDQYNLLNSLMTGYGVSAIGLAVIYRLVNPIGWALVLRGLGQQAPYIQATRIWLQAESRRWLPGGIWGYASRSISAQSLGVPVGISSASMLLELILTMLAAVTVSLVGAAIYWSNLADKLGEVTANASPSNASIMLGLCTLLLLTTTLVMFGEVISRKLQAIHQRFGILKGLKFQTKSLLSAFGYFVLMAILNGSINQTLAAGFSSSYNVPFVAMIAATAIAWIVGFLAIFSPGGLLVREGTLAMLLLPWINYEEAFLIAVASRLVQMFAEVVGMLLVTIRQNPARCLDESSPEVQPVS